MRLFYTNLVVNKNIKAKENFADNEFHNTLGRDRARRAQEKTEM